MDKAAHPFDQMTRFFIERAQALYASAPVDLNMPSTLALLHQDQPLQLLIVDEIAEQIGADGPGALKFIAESMLGDPGYFGYVHIAEIWASAQAVELNISPAEAPDRQDLLSVTAVERGGRKQFLTFKIEPAHSGASGRQLTPLEAIVDGDGEEHIDGLVANLFDFAGAQPAPGLH